MAYVLGGENSIGALPADGAARLTRLHLYYESTITYLRVEFFSP
jgi:hypothetical protein